VPDLTTQQAEFSRQYVLNGGDGTAAAKAAGFSERSAAQRAYELRQKPHVQEAIHREQRRAFTELASISLAQAKAMLEDPKTPAGARVELVKTMLDRAGLAALRGGDADDGEGKSLREMSLDELEEIARSLRDRAGA
jgi:hypothetical protein